MENHTVRHSRAKLGGVLRDRRAPDGGSRRPTIKALSPYGGLSCAFANDRSSGERSPHRRLRSAKPMCSEPWGFQYGLAKSRTENPQAMGHAGKTPGICRHHPPLPGELQKSWQYRPRNE